jgi:hypothetical protein
LGCAAEYAAAARELGTVADSTSDSGLIEQSGVNAKTFLIARLKQTFPIK